MTDRASGTAPGPEWLSGLDAHLAILDARGVVTDENKSWDAFMGDELAYMPAVEMNRSYVDILMQRARDTGNLVALDAAKGIGKVLDGASERFLFEYPVHPSGRGAWLSLQAVPGKSGAVILHTRYVPGKPAGALSPEPPGSPGSPASANQISQAGKMEVIGTLASGIAHDFNNILGGIIGYSELVTEDLEEMDQASFETLERMDNIMAAANRARNLVAQILAFSRSGREDKQPVHLRYLVKEVIRFMRASLPAYIEIDRFLESDSHVLADPTQIHQILMNLCTNAKDAMAESGGTLSIHLRDVEMSQDKLRFRKQVTPGAYVRLSVTDTGCGIDDGIIDRIMDPFFTTKPEGKGTGMGMSVVKGIVQGLDGFIEVSSQKSVGTRFDVYLPASEAPQAHPVPEATDRSAREGTERILFVDDEEALTQIAVDALPILGYQVIPFTDGGTALDFFAENIDACDIVVSDIAMPGIPGDRLVREMRHIRPDLPVILITGASERMDQPRARKAGIDALLYKPVTINTMADTIRKVLDGEYQWPES